MAYSGPTITQSSHQDASLSSTLAWSPTVTAGKRVVILTANSVSTAATVTGIADSQGNTYTQHVSQSQNSRSCSIWSGVMGSSGSNTITITYSAATYWHASFVEVDACVLDTFSSFGNSTSATTVYCAASGEIDTAANTLLLAVFAANASTGTVTQASGFTLLSSTTDSNHNFGVQSLQSEAGETDQRCLFTLGTARLGPGAVISFVNTPDTYAETGSGGAVVGGYADSQVTLNVSTAGGEIVDGQSEASAIYNLTTSDGGFVGGLADVATVQSVVSTGGAVVGGAALLDAQTFSETGAGGGVAGGSADVERTCQLAGVGGSVAGGSAEITTNYHVIASDGAVAGGSAVLSVSLSAVGSGGLTIGGSAAAAVTTVIETYVYCPCNVFSETAAGGLSAGGAATNTKIGIEGGVSPGGSALVSLYPDAYDGLAGVYPLGDDYEDRTRNHLDGTAYGVTPDDGIFCLASSYLDGRDYISVPSDGITQAFSVSCWVKIQSRFSERVFLSRGGFSLGTSYINHLMARLVLADDGETVTYLAFGDILAQDKWYHVAATWTPLDALRVYVNGVLSGTTETPSGEFVAGISQLGRRDHGQGMIGHLQEVRLFPDVRSAAYLKAEHDNFCRAFFAVGETMGATG